MWGSSARYLTMKVHAALAVSWPPIKRPRILSAISNSFIYCPSSLHVNNMWDNMSCVGDAFPSVKSTFLCLMVLNSSFLMKLAALIALLKDVPGKSMGNDMIPEAKRWKGSSNFATWFTSSTLMNKRQANKKVYLLFNVVAHIDTQIYISRIIAYTLY